MQPRIDAYRHQTVQCMRQRSTGIKIQKFGQKGGESEGVKSILRSWTTKQPLNHHVPVRIKINVLLLYQDFPYNLHITKLLLSISYGTGMGCYSSLSTLAERWDTRRDPRVGGEGQVPQLFLSTCPSVRPAWKTTLVEVSWCTVPVRNIVNEFEVAMGGVRPTWLWFTPWDLSYH